MSDFVTIGTVPWSNIDIRTRLEEFITLYQSRPIKDNTGGMRFPHMFAAWFMLSMLKPKVIIESGVFRGQGTWLFEQACPEAQMYCIDINLKHIQYRSRKAQYISEDFSTIDWSHVPMDDTVCFFDDHQNAYERVKSAYWFGFRDLMFEDNYPAAQGDFYSLKKVWMKAGMCRRMDTSSPLSLVDLLRRRKNSTSRCIWEVTPNSVDAGYLRRNLEIYYEFPPVLRLAQTRWGDRWDNVKYPTPAALFGSDDGVVQLYRDELKFYTWMCYARLKKRAS